MALQEKLTANIRTFCQIFLKAPSQRRLIGNQQDLRAEQDVAKQRKRAEALAGRRQREGHGGLERSATSQNWSELT
jgi:hypothetical protein